jgi:transcriptional regulator with XRE-family HTH domain
MQEAAGVPADPGIGARLKAARQARRLTLTDVAQASGLTKGFLSKLERDQVSASVAALVRVCAALEISPGSLFGPTPTGEVVRAGEYPPIAFGGAGLREYLLSPAGERRLQAILSEISPGGGSGAETYSLPADVEFVLVLEGELEVTTPGTTTVLRSGDAFTFPPSVAHGFRSLRTDGPTRVLWVLTPALSARRPVLPAAADGVPDGLGNRS